MGLNIKNEHVHELARQAAQRTGKNQTSAIEAALQNYLKSLDRLPEATQVTRRKIERVLTRIDARLTPEDRARLRDTDLYDESGLPR